VNGRRLVPLGAAAPEVAPLRVVIFGLSITSSWGNGHATTYRALVRELAARGHDVLFLERDVPWYAEHRDLPRPPYGRTALYSSLDEARERHGAAVHEADLVIVGSFVPEGVAVGDWVTRHAGGVTAFYDIDTPVTLARLARGEAEYLSAALVPRYDLYLSFTGGPTLKRLEREYGARAARPLYCSSDPEIYKPQREVKRWAVGYLGTYSPDRQPSLDALLLQPARAVPSQRFVVAGALYPTEVVWPENVAHVPHLPPAEHRRFYNAQRYTLNITRADMIAAGFSPSVRLFEAAACGTPIVSDYWSGLDTLFEPGREILIARSADDVLRFLRDVPETERRAIGARARDRVLAEHTSAHRAAELESYALESLARRRPASLASRRDVRRRAAR
jgi:spore maturation protein CgeB